VGTQRASALWFADPKTQALGAALLLFQLLPTGFTNRNLREHLAPSLGLAPDELTPARLTCELRRLRLHGIIERIPGTHRYRLTGFGSRKILFLTRGYARILRPGFGSILPNLSAPNCALRRSFDNLDQQVSARLEKAKLAA